jgi:cyanophycin synthetase
VTDGLLAGWQARVEAARHQLGWPSDASWPIVARTHRGGASLAFAAPVDQLLTATEINEWALCSTLLQLDPRRWQDLEATLVATTLEQATDAPLFDAPVLDDDAARSRFERLSRAESRPNVVALIEAAHAKRVPYLLDDESLTLGAGTHARTWPLAALPSPADVAWHDPHGIPIAAVTGSNGKTTTVRLIAACLRAHGLRDGYCCTDGVFIDRQVVEAGDYSGPAGARRVLRDSRVEAAALEVARGGILRRGLTIARADVAVVTNISADHFGEYGIDDLDGLADTKLTLAMLVADAGLLVLNADDATLRSKAMSMSARIGSEPWIGWFSLDYEDDWLLAHRVKGGVTAGIRDGRLTVSSSTGAEHDLGCVQDMPITVDGAATYNVANLAAAALAAVHMGVPPATVRRVFAQFGRDPADNAGRLMRFDVRRAVFIVDYAHNPDGLRGVLHVTRQLRRDGGRLITLLGHAGNRRDEDIAEVATVTASFAPDIVVIKEDEGHLRGRQPGEVPAILRRALLAAGMPPTSIVMCASESDAARYALDTARPGDAVALLMHSPAARSAVLQLLRNGA